MKGALYLHTVFLRHGNFGTSCESVNKKRRLLLFCFLNEQAYLPEFVLVVFLKQKHFAHIIFLFSAGPVCVGVLTSSDGSSYNTSPVRGSNHLAMTEVQVSPRVPEVGWW